VTTKYVKKPIFHPNAVSDFKNGSCKGLIKLKSIPEVFFEKGGSSSVLKVLIQRKTGVKDMHPYPL